MFQKQLQNGLMNIKKIQIYSTNIYILATCDIDLSFTKTIDFYPLQFKKNAI